MKASEMTPDFSKYETGLVPVVIQDAHTRVVLMLGFMNNEALNKTRETGKVCFYSRSRQRLWTKGEESGNYLQVENILADCDNDTLLINVKPAGPVCHTGQDTCFGWENKANFLVHLEKVIENRRVFPQQDSYVSSLFTKGINSIAQKVGEEAVELIIESKDNDDSRFLNEAADLLFHYLVLLRAKGKYLADVEAILASRHRVLK